MRKLVSQTAVNALTFAKVYWEQRYVYPVSTGQKVFDAVFAAVAIILWMWVLSILIKR